MKVRVAAVQPESIYGEEEYRNAEQAVSYLEEAAQTGAHLVCFPEGYPGPAHGPLDSGGKLKVSPIEAICRKAKELGVWVAASNVEAASEFPGAYFLCQKLISPSGEIVADYRRVQPDEPDLNEYLFGGKRHFVPGEGAVVVDTELGKIGLLICSELFVPELARIEMLKGAEIIIAPVNGVHGPTWLSTDYRLMCDTWRCISRARAAENLIYVIVTQNLFVKGYKGLGHIASPEKMLAQSEKSGIFTAELDMERLRWLRSNVVDWRILGDPEGAKGEIELPLSARPGQHILRRPEVYGPLTQPLPSDYDYFYYRQKQKPSQQA